MSCTPSDGRGQREGPVGGCAGAVPFLASLDRVNRRHPWGPTTTTARGRGPAGSPPRRTAGPGCGLRHRQSVRPAAPHRRRSRRAGTRLGHRRRRGAAARGRPGGGDRVGAVQLLRRGQDQRRRHAASRRPRPLLRWGRRRFGRCSAPSPAVVGGAAGVPGAADAVPRCAAGGRRLLAQSRAGRRPGRGSCGGTGQHPARAGTAPPHRAAPTAEPPQPRRRSARSPTMCCRALGFGGVSSGATPSCRDAPDSRASP